MTHDHSDTMAELARELFQQRDGVKRLLEELLNAAMRAEVSEQLGTARHERNPQRQGWRNGAKPRKLKTRAGELELRVPQVRNSEPYHPSMFARWQRAGSAGGLCRDIFPRRFDAAGAAGARSNVRLRCLGDDGFEGGRRAG